MIKDNRTCSCVLTQKLMCSCNAFTPTPTHTHTHAHTPTCTHTHAHMHPHAPTHTHTHTHTTSRTPTNNHNKPHRLGSPDECAGAVSFLCSDDASYITGETIVMAGGLLSRL